MPTPYQNKTIRNYLVLNGRVTREGYKYLKMINIYWKTGKNG